MRSKFCGTSAWTAIMTEKRNHSARYAIFSRVTSPYDEAMQMILNDRMAQRRSTRHRRNFRARCRQAQQGLSA